MNSDATFTTTDKNGAVRIVKREIMASEVFPPPDDLPPGHAALWQDALCDMPAKFFRRRHLGLLRQYVRQVALLDEFDPLVDPKGYYRTLKMVASMQRHLGFAVPQEITRSYRDQDARHKRELREKMLREKLAAEKGANDAASAGGASPATSRAHFSFSKGKDAA